MCIRRLKTIKQQRIRFGIRSVAVVNTQNANKDTFPSIFLFDVVCTRHVCVVFTMEFIRNNVIFATAFVLVHRRYRCRRQTRGHCDAMVLFRQFCRQKRSVHCATGQSRDEFIRFNVYRL